MPAMVAERKLAMVPAITARMPSAAKSCRLDGASAPIPPTWMACFSRESCQQWLPKESWLWYRQSLLACRAQPSRAAWTVPVHQYRQPGWHASLENHASNGCRKKVGYGTGNHCSHAERSQVVPPGRCQCTNTAHLDGMIL